MMLQGKERDEAVKELILAGVEDFKLTKEQSTKRVNALVEAIDNGMFDGIPETGPSDFMQMMFVNVKIEQFMKTNID